MIEHSHMNRQQVEHEIFARVELLKNANGISQLEFIIWMLDNIHQFKSIRISENCLETIRFLLLEFALSADPEKIMSASILLKRLYEFGLVGVECVPVDTGLIGHLDVENKQYNLMMKRSILQLAEVSSEHRVVLF